MALKLVPSKREFLQRLGPLVDEEVTEAELRLFAPLAWTKTFAMVMAFALAIVIVPALALVTTRRASSAGARRFFRGAHLRHGVLILLGLAALWISVPGGLLVPLHLCVACGALRELPGRLAPPPTVRAL